MKYALFLMLFTYLILGVENSYADESCVEDIEYLCSGERESWRIKELRKLNENAFEELLKETEMEDLICKNFDRESGVLVYKFLWNRSCWDWKYRKSIRRMGIKSCGDFIKHGASRNFLLNCYSLIDNYLYNQFSYSLSFKTKKIIERVKFRMTLAISSEAYSFLVERSLRNIADSTHIELNLSQYEAKFMSTKDLCERVDDQSFCDQYGKSEKVFLSLGAHALYDDHDLEMFVAMKMAEYLADTVKLYERFNLQTNYIALLSEVVSQWRLEQLLARSMSNDVINKETLSAMIMQKYIKVNNLEKYFRRNKSLDMICTNGEQLNKNRNDYYYDYFVRLHPKDRMELILCKD